MRRLLIGFILLFAITVQAQEKRIEDWMAWLYLPEDGILLFRGYYAEQGDTVEFIPVTFERSLQMPEAAPNLPKSVLVSDDASSLAYVVNTLSTVSESSTAPSFAKIIVSEIFAQGFYEHEIRTFDATSVSIAFHSTEQIRALGHTLYHEQQRLPTLASQYPDRERKLAYAYQDIRESWRIEVFDVNAEQLLNQFDATAILELEAERVIVHRFQDDVIVFSTIRGGDETLYELSLMDSSVRELPPFVLSTQSSDYAIEANEALAIDGDLLLYYRNPDGRGTALFEGEALSFPRFVQNGEWIAFVHDASLSLLEPDGTVLMDDFAAPNMTQMMSVPTGFVYLLENEAFSELNYFHTLEDEFNSERFVIWGNYGGETPVQLIYVHRKAE